MCCFIVTLLVELLEWSSVEAFVERAPSEGHQPVDRACYGTGLLQDRNWQRLKPPWSWQLTSTGRIRTWLVALSQVDYFGLSTPGTAMLGPSAAFGRSRRHLQSDYPSLALCCSPNESYN